MKVALIHDFLRTVGGAEKVLLEFTKLFPDAPIYTLLYEPEKFTGLIDQSRVKTSFLQNLHPRIRNSHKLLLPLYPIAIEKFDLSEYDLVISSSSAFAKGVITRSNTKHICYCHTPMRYIWDSFPSYIENQKINRLLKPFVFLYLNYLRLWDKASSSRVDKFIANSKNVSSRISKYYRNDSIVIHPPVDVNSFQVSDQNANYFLIVSRLEPYKRIETAIKAFNLLPNRQLIIIGDGSDMNRLKKMASKNIEFLGHESDEIIKEYFKNCRAFIATAIDEDFGITPVEAMACGKPVLALKSGGYKESVIDGVTGIFYENDTPKDLMNGLIKLLEQEESFNHSKIRKHAENFSTEHFENKLADLLDGII